MLRNRFSDYVAEAPVDQKTEQRFIPPPVYLLGALGAMVLLNRIFPGPKVVPAGLRRLGLVGILAGMGLGAWGAVLFRKTGTPVIPTEKPTALVNDGPYRFTRNPMYLGMAVLLGGVGILMAGLLPLLVIPVFLGLLTSQVIRREEQTLAQSFGEAYQRYVAKVPRWL